MKKGLLILIVAALVLGLTSCSQDVYSKLGDMMGKMGNNVYGIKPNMAQVEAATQSLDSSVSSDGAGNVSVDLDKASQIISAVATIKDSSQKAEALKNELSKPIVSDSSEAIAVRDELQATVGSIASTIPDVSELAPNLSDSQKELINDIKTAIGNVTISDNPTKAELATVAVLDALAQAAVDVSANAANLMDSNGLTEQGMAVAETALSSLDALKVVSEVANINVLGDLDLMSILGNLTGSRAISDEAKQYLDALNKTLLKVFGLISKNEAGNRVFDENNYKKFIAQAKAIRSSYELVAAPYLSSVSTFEQVDDLLSMKIDHNLTIDDMLLYLLTAAFTEADGAAHDEIEALAVQFFSLGGYSALQNGADFDFSQLDDELDDLQSALLTSFTGSGSCDWEDVLAAVKVGGSKYMTGVKMVGTMTIMLVNSGYQSLLSQISDGTVSGLMK